MAADAQVIVSKSPNAGLLERLGGYITELLALSLLQMLLFKSNVAFEPGLDLAAMGPEADYAGYGRLTVSAIHGPYLDQAGSAYAVTNLLDFVCTGGGNSNQIYNAALCGTNGTAATATATSGAPGPITAVTLTGGGSGYVLPPSYTISGGGTGAVLAFTIVGGVITAIDLVDAGTGYTTPTVTIQPPVGLLEVFPLAPVTTMGLATDALPIVGQINDPAINA